MTATRHILVLEQQRNPQLPVIPRSVAKDAPVVARVVRRISAALRELRGAGYDAVFLRVEQPDELSLLLRIKTASPETPLCALMSAPNQDLERMAHDSGADEVHTDAWDPEDDTATVDRAMAGTESLILRSRELVARSMELRERWSELKARAKALNLYTFDLAKIPVKELAPLLIEDDSDHAFFLKRSFSRLKLPFPLPVMPNGEEAISYLSGKGKYRDRSKYPIPTLVILDLHLPRVDGMDVLRWIRSQPALSKLVIFIFSSSPLRSDLELALGLGADCFYVKPIGLDALDDITRVMAVRWSLIYKTHCGRKKKQLE